MSLKRLRYIYLITDCICHSTCKSRIFCILDINKVHFPSFLVSQLLKKLNNLQSSTSKLQEQNQRLQQKTKRLEEQKAGWLQDKRLQQENEKSRKHQTTMTEQEQVNMIIFLLSGHRVLLTYKLLFRRKD